MIVDERLFDRDHGEDRGAPDGFRQPQQGHAHQIAITMSIP
jgi:hypothetical protein